VPAPVVQALREEGIDVSSFKPQALTEGEVASAARVVAIGVDIGTLGAKAGDRLERWDDIPPVSTSYPVARAAMVARLRALLQELDPAQSVTFDEQKPGEGPRGMTCALTGKGRPGTWTVREEAGAPSRGIVLVQTDADATSYRFPHCVLDGVVIADLTLSVKLKPVSGRVDQAGGLVFRYRDPLNYYVVRANALESNVVLYKVEKGRRTDLKAEGTGFMAYGKKASVPSGAWSELRVVAHGGRFEVALNGEPLFQVQDATFAAPGQVGVWTKADSVTQFDDLKVSSAN
jgi:hypothetical protein